MSTSAWIRPVGYDRWCRLAVIGDDSHATACLARISAREPMIVTTKQPDEHDTCGACWRDLEVRRQRANTVDLRPAARERGVPADLELDDAPGPDSEAIRRALDAEDLLDVPVEHSA